MIERSTTYAVAKPPLCAPCATSSICTASAAIASIAAKYAARKARSSVSKRVAYAMKPCQGLALDVRHPLLAPVAGERGAQRERDDARAEQPALRDGAVRAEERVAPVRGQEAPDELQVDRRIRAAEVDPVDHAARGLGG